MVNILIKCPPNFKPSQGKTSPNIIMTSTNITPYPPRIKHGLPKKKHLVDGDSHVWGQSSLPLGNLPSPGSTKALFGSHPVDLMLDIGAVVQDLILAPALFGPATARRCWLQCLHKL